MEVTTNAFSWIFLGAKKFSSFRSVLIELNWNFKFFETLLHENFRKNVCIYCHEKIWRSVLARNPGPVRAKWLTNMVLRVTHSAQLNNSNIPRYYIKIITKLSACSCKLLTWYCAIFFVNILEKMVLDFVITIIILKRCSLWQMNILCHAA